VKIIQSIADLEELKARGTIPLPYVKIIEKEFLDWYEAASACESIKSFRLEPQSCFYHLEDTGDTEFIRDQLIHIEFVEYEKVDQHRYFRLGLMHDNEMSLIFFLEGTIEPKLEGWLTR